MILSDRDIVERIDDGSLVIEPFKESNVEPSSVDLRLGSDAKLVAAPGLKSSIPVETKRRDDTFLQYTDVTLRDGGLEIKPGDFIIASTEERVEVPDDLVAKVLGRSSLGRLGVSVHQTAGYIDPGFKGEITLELSNHGPAPVMLHTGQRICQIVFTKLTSPAEKPYGHEKSQYQNQEGATPSGMRFD